MASRTSPFGAISYGSAANKTTTVDTYADVVALDVALMRSKQFVFTATTNTLTVRILGSIDGGVTYPFTAEAAFDVTTATPVTKSLTTFFTHLKIQVMPKVAGVHGTLATAYAAASF